jgi:hypothetical protein
MTRGAAFPLLVATLAVACPPAVRAAQSTTQDVAVLERGAALVRTLTGGERHGYGLTLDAGDYARLTIDQRGVDVTVRILDSAGKVVAEFDAETRKAGQEHVALVAPAAGTQQLSVAARYSRHEPGSYQRDVP